MFFKSKNLLPAAVISLALGAACNPATAATVSALSVNQITNFSMSSTGVTFTGFTFSNDTAATENGGTGGADLSDAPAACIGDCAGWENQFGSHAPYSSEFSYGDAQIINDDVLAGNGAASSIGEVVVTDGIAHASGSNVLTSIGLTVDAFTELSFSFDVNALLEVNALGADTSNAANMFFNITLTDSLNSTVFSWSPDELNHGITGTGSYSFNDVLSATTNPLGAGNYSLNIKMENQASAAVVPVPAAIWLFGSGLLGLAGVARRKQSV